MTQRPVAHRGEGTAPRNPYRMPGSDKESTPEPTKAPIDPVWRLISMPRRRMSRAGTPSAGSSPGQSAAHSLSGPTVRRRGSLRLNQELTRFRPKVGDVPDPSIAAESEERQPGHLLATAHFSTDLKLVTASEAFCTGFKSGGAGCSHWRGRPRCAEADIVAGRRISVGRLGFW
jgi:hypothetical protein